MLRVVYHSKQTETMTPGGFDALCLQARKNNAAQGIGGLLLKDQTDFLQYLEGPADQIKLLFNKILRDPRHYDVRLLESSKTRIRLFAGWHMGGVDSDTGRCQQLTFPVATLTDLMGKMPMRRGLTDAQLIYEYGHMCRLLVDQRAELGPLIR